MLDILDVNDEGNSTNQENPTVIKVVGCGGNAVNNMVNAGINGVEFIALNTDLQHLSVSKADHKIQIGKKITGGLGAGMHPEIGRDAALEEEETIKQLLTGSDMVFITAGMGGGTGTGSAPVVAKIAKELGILTVGVVTTPFAFEGNARFGVATEGIKNLRSEVDSLIVIPNQRVFEGSDKKPSVPQGFRIIDDILRQGVQGISEIITKIGLVNRDFKDVETVMKGQGDAILGMGVGEGENRAVDAATNAINNKLLADTHIDGAKNILIKISGNESIGIDECNEIVESITASASPEVRVLWGLYIEPELEDKVSVTVIATGFNSAKSAITDEQAGETPAVPVDNTFVNAEQNTVSVGVFERIMSGNPDIPSSPVTERANVTPEEVNKLIGRTPDVAPASSKPGSLTAAMTTAAGRPVPASIIPPSNFHSTGDINEPTVWRELSKSINLTQK